MLVRITDSDESVRKRRREGTCTFLKCSEKMVSYPRSTIGLKTIARISLMEEFLFKEI